MSVRLPSLFVLLAACASPIAAQPPEDALHCGPARAACPVATARTLPVCVEGRCLRACRVGYAECDGTASTECETETLVDPCHCGGCATRCAEGLFCVAGACTPRQDPIVRRGPAAPGTCR